MTSARPRLAWLLLASTLAATLLFEPSAWHLLLAAAATLTFARDRRFGPLPAAMLVCLALPFDRAANNDLFRILGYPLRPHDVAIGIGILLALPSLRRPAGSGVLLAIGGFLTIGVGALLAGLVADYPLRDVFRDARWWSLYGAGVLALASGVRRSQIIRALVWGCAAFAALAVATTILPPFPGGLKARALVFDIGTLRMQFGNTTFLLPALALVLWRFARQPGLASGSLAWLLAVAATLSLTRTYVAVVILVVLTILVAAAVGRRRHGGLLRSLGAGTLLVVAIASGIGFNLEHGLVGEMLARIMTVPAEPVTRDPGETAIDRLVFEGDRADVGQIVEGRFATYARAAEVVQRSPLVGHGLGTLVRVHYAFGGDPFDTPGWLPNVDNAYLTAGMKAGALGIAALAAMLLSLPLALVRRRPLRRLAPWLLPAWGGLLVLTVTQSFATIGYSPYVLSLLLSLGGLGYAASSASRARAQL